MPRVLPKSNADIGEDTPCFVVMRDAGEDGVRAAASPRSRSLSGGVCGRTECDSIEMRPRSDRRLVSRGGERGLGDDDGGDDDNDARR